MWTWADWVRVDERVWCCLARVTSRGLSAGSTVCSRSAHHWFSMTRTGKKDCAENEAIIFPSWILRLNVWWLLIRWEEKCFPQYFVAPSHPLWPGSHSKIPASKLYQCVKSQTEDEWAAAAKARLTNVCSRSLFVPREPHPSGSAAPPSPCCLMWLCMRLWGVCPLTVGVCRSSLSGGT